MELVYQYVQALQAAMYAGAHVRMELRGRSVGVVSVKVGDGWLNVGYITPASPDEQLVLMSLATRFLVVFDDWPEVLAQAGWYR